MRVANVVRKVTATVTQRLPYTPPVPGAWVTTPTARVFYRVAGERDAVGNTVPLVLVHGLGVSSAYFARVQPLLAAGRVVYAPDLPGFGRTHPRPSHALGAIALAERLREWMNAMGLSRVHLLGHSLGGPIAAEFACLHPERVGCLLLVGATIGPASPQMPRQVGGLLCDFLLEPPTVFPVLFADYVRSGTRRIVATEVIVDGEDTLASLAHVPAPVLIVRGGHDPIVLRKDVERMREAAPHARYVEVPGAPHVLQWGYAPRLAQIIAAFLGAEEPTSDGPAPSR